MPGVGSPASAGIEHGSEQMKNKPTFIGKKWTLETERVGDDIFGYITDAVSAATNKYKLVPEGISHDGHYWMEVPPSVVIKLGVLMRKMAKSR